MRLNVSQVILGSGNLSHSAFHALRASIPPKDLILSLITEKVSHTFRKMSTIKIRNVK